MFTAEHFKKESYFNRLYWIRDDLERKVIDDPLGVITPKQKAFRLFEAMFTLLCFEIRLIVAIYSL